MEESGLNRYLDEIGRESLLTADEERDLALKIQQGESKALNRLVEANLRFVVSIANQYKGKGLQMDDLVSEGNKQIEKAIAQQTDPPKGKASGRNNGDLPLKATSVDAPLGHRNNMSLLSVLVNQDAPLADERVHSEAIEEVIEFALGSLDERESRVINAFFGINQEHETMAEIAEDMDLKRERVRQIRDKAVRKLRKAYKSRLQKLKK